VSGREERGAGDGAGGTQEGAVLGLVANPPNKESTSEEFYFWVGRGRAVEKMQVVRTRSKIGGSDVTFYAQVLEVYRQSRQKDPGDAEARHDGDAAFRPPFAVEGFNYARARILRTEPPVLTPPVEESKVFLGDAGAARTAYGADRVGDPLPVGLIRNGGSALAGPGLIDLDYLLGKNGGHLNVNGIAGLGTKSSLLLHVNYLLLRHAAEVRRRYGGKDNRLQVVPIVFNVKNYDLFHIDRWNRHYEAAKHAADWHALGVDKPEPFRGVKFYAPQQRNLDIPANVGRDDTKVEAYSWSLGDLIEQGLFRYLFAEEDVNDPNFGGLVNDLEEKLTDDGGMTPKLRDGDPRTLKGLVDWFKGNHNSQFGDHHPATRGKFLRRLRKLVQEGDGVLRRDQQEGKPLVMPEGETDGPLVIDLYALAGQPALQRFVVAAVFHQLVERRSGQVTKGLRYLVTLDELNRFAPKNRRDPITEKIEQVAAEMRSQGILLLGAQQQASLVSPRVIENAGIRAVGASGALEMGAEVWRFLSDTARRKAAQLLAEEKLLIQPSFREPMLVKIPFPPWALNGEDAGEPVEAPAAGSAGCRVPEEAFA
jgi:uncharacterized protein